ncbi:MAG: aldehyde dehydrogenase family protein [Polyangiaceae bacterium]|nr:aldehyde dehydrogenase family protein [Polyangiaceae bacterium]
MTYGFLKELGIAEVNSGVAYGPFLDNPSGGELVSESPIDGKPIAKVLKASSADYELIMSKAVAAFKTWRMVPGPKRAELVRAIGDELRAHKESLGQLVTLEMGKIAAEGVGEVQEMIDMADFAVGQGRMLYGLTMQSERVRHRMMEQWHPLGAVGVISAFNFPVAVYAWNALLAAVCGDVIVWKPSSNTPLTAIATQKIFHRVAERFGYGEGIFNLVIGSGREVGELMLADPRLPMISATGSTEVGRKVAAKVGQRLGRTILELGGNNAVVVMDDADMRLAVSAVLFGAVGTAGQRCTSTRRVLLHKGIADDFTRRLLSAYGQVKIGNPLDSSTLMGPLVSKSAVADMQAGLAKIREQGGEVIYGGEVLSGPGYESGCYVKPCIVKAKRDMPIVQDEIFAPILYLIEIDGIDDAILVHNDVPQGLSSSMFTLNMRNAEQFLCPEGSDCGIANINIGTSGAEIGGAFGGEKETGGGRESGSDSWKQYMRRQTNTINYSTELPLAQGIKFGE